MFTDTHCHLTEPSLACRLPELFVQARAAGVTQFIAPATQPNDWQAVLNLAQYDAVRVRALGIHPWFVSPQSAGCLSDLETHLQRDAALWLGEIGLDFYDKQQTPTQSSLQIQIFEMQLNLAQHYHRPIILHNLKATATIISSLQRTHFTQGGIVHAFSGSAEEAKLFIKQGFLIGIGHLLLNPNAKKARWAAQYLPLDCLVLETDSPFGIKNQDNTPANVRVIAEQVAQLRGIGLDKLAMACEQNLRRLLP